ncbi:Solitary outer membrane autotransporter beta-barrel domain [Vibrio proteolyticus]|uniref:Solitary outer membrane autotransporter-like beta-barrel domain-containing protein n=1 Tax=Vibrio proteolyticus NBRC 13287 TaxID=1219065 RepID=U3A1T0_VIBPR|nr:Solitary outer membrane autotransporter beta-barrel domain [Vibrio proteolyticus]GAD67292.1 hypothetical protein VPR01S_07_00910 [Vibrio proteolyticus NBRC 13287]
MKRTFLTYRVALFFSVLTASQQISANQLDDAIIKSFEHRFASVVVLTDTDVIKFGVNDFNPNRALNLDNENLGSDDAVERRKQNSVVAIPLTFEFDEPDSDNQHRIYLRLSGIFTDSDTQLLQGDVPEDNLKETIISGFAAYRYRMNLTENWRLIPGIGTHLIHYKNDFTANSLESQELIDVFLKDRLVDVSAWSNIYEPTLKFEYHDEPEWGKWKVVSSWHYFYGYGWGDANSGNVGNPEGWYVSNGAELFYNITQWGNSLQSLYASISRIDLGGDTPSEFGTDYYYETSIGWLMTPPFEADWIDNIGIGINVNYGSDYKGGSIVLFFNQD